MSAIDVRDPAKHEYRLLTGQVMACQNALCVSCRTCHHGIALQNHWGKRVIKTDFVQGSLDAHFR